MTTPRLNTPDLPTSTPSSPPPLPPPSTFDILPPLHELLSRLLTDSSALPEPLGTPSKPPQTPKPAKITSNDPNVITYNELVPLEIKQLATEASKLKIRLQKARQRVKAMPDIDRTVNDQMEEIEELAAKCEALQTELRGMATRAGRENSSA
ncbi:hypothetical protein NA57DRAFT_78288 [Rhizodiscina lignyota]|uniref:Mediator of RNA polymerase II transcription subunit 9 n=1 Tax=Rhizodiscina lignyota TaxID=1504668 RepID=A0A9P4ICD7_9PEZI|nr:hypothetical protein NA57DRAFT_78288 [Rhizodiscina lignyota]